MSSCFDGNDAFQIKPALEWILSSHVSKIRLATRLLEGTVVRRNWLSPFDRCCTRGYTSVEGPWNATLGEVLKGNGLRKVYCSRTFRNSRGSVIEMLLQGNNEI